MFFWWFLIGGGLVSALLLLQGAFVVMQTVRSVWALQLLEILVATVGGGLLVGCLALISERFRRARHSGQIKPCTPRAY
jgi:hypothetical protein